MRDEKVKPAAREALDQEKIVSLYPDLEPLESTISRFNFLRSKPEKRFVREQQRCAEDLARIATQDNYDCLSVLLAVEAGFSALLSPYKASKKAGRVIVNEVENYFKNQQVVYKSLLPTNSEESDSLILGIETVKASLKNIRNYYQQLEQRKVQLPPTLLFFLNDVILAIETSPEQTHPIILTIADRGRLREITGYQEKKESYNSIMELWMKCCNSDTFGTSFADLAIPRKIIEIAQQGSRYPVEGMPDIWTAEYGGIAFKDLVEENDEVEFTSKLFSYIKHSPKGNLLWQRLIALFWLYFNSSYLAKLDSESLKSLSSDLLAGKILYSQCLLSELLLAPVFDESYLDEEFDNSFLNDLLPNLEPTNIKILQGTVILTATHITWTIRAFMQDLNVWEAIQRSPVTSIAISDFLEKHPKHMSVNINDVVFDFLAKHQEEIKENWRSRFSKSRQLKNFIATMDYLFNIETSEINTSLLKELIYEHGKGTEQLEIKADKTKEVDRDKRKIYGSLKRDFATMKETILSDETEVGLSQDFTQGSLPESLGFRRILIELDPWIAPTAINFLLRTSKLDISGIFNTQTCEIETPFFSWDDDLRQVKDLIEKAVLVTFYNLALTRGVVMKLPAVIKRWQEELGLTQYKTPEDIERAAWELYQNTGTLTHQLLQSHGLALLSEAITDNYPGGMRKLKERLRFTKKPAEIPSLPPAQANEEFIEFITRI